MTLEDAREYFGGDKFATKTTGIEIVEVGDHYSKCVLQVEEKHLAALGQVMGGAIFTLADFAFAVASNDREHFTVTSSSTINFCSPAKDKTLTAECRCIKEGRKVCTYETTVRDGLGNIVALVTAGGFHTN